MSKEANKIRETEKALQAAGLALYRAVVATGILNTAWGRSLFERAYLCYKDRYEARSIALLRAYVRPDTLVLDIGANIGFFTRQFAAWVSGSGYVIALEPEATNEARLRRMLSRAGLADRVQVCRLAAADTTGEATLEINPTHPGDHKLAAGASRQGQEPSAEPAPHITVPVTTIDDLLAPPRQRLPVSLIKIDVQGAEPAVLAGATSTLQQYRPVLYLEVHDEGLRRYGSSGAGLLTMCETLGYTLHMLKDQAITPPLNSAEILRQEQARGYVDVLLLPSERSASSEHTGQNG